MGVENTISKLKRYFEIWHESEGTHAGLMYPVGSIYMSVDAKSPAVLFGGTWEKIEGRFLLSSQEHIYECGTEGGDKDAHLIKHTHTQEPHTHTQEPHTHTQNGHNHEPYKSKGAANEKKSQFMLTNCNIEHNNTKRALTSTNSKGNYFVISDNKGDIFEHTVTANTTATNKNATAINKDAKPTIHNEGEIDSGIDKNMPPYFVVHMWKRTA